MNHVNLKYIIIYLNDSMNITFNMCSIVISDKIYNIQLNLYMWTWNINYNDVNKQVINVKWVLLDSKIDSARKLCTCSLLKHN